MKQQKNIVLVGMMGCGKSTVAEQLVQKSDRFVLKDVDAAIVEFEGCSISQIFENKGEAYFRQLESQVIETIATHSNFVIATGGGACVNPKNIQHLKKSGVIFYLKVGIDELLIRLQNDSSRPLLNVDDVSATLTNLLAERENSYKLADFTICADNRVPSEIADEILEKYYENERT